MHKSAKWIWAASQPCRNDVYAEFYDCFEYHGGSVSLSISADSNYAVYLNGQYVASGQYPDFPHYKVYDQIDLTPFCTTAKQQLAIIVWHFGTANMSYFPGQAALMYAVKEDGRLLRRSRKGTLSRISRAYRQGEERIITGQLGYSFHYDASAEDHWMQGELDEFANSQIVQQSLPLHSRPIDRCIVEPGLTSTLLLSDHGAHFLYDLHAEQVGYLSLAVESPIRQSLKIRYGEHIADGDVRDRIGSRDFSVHVTVPAGRTVYMNPFRRLGARYLALEAEAPLTVNELTLCPVVYPLERLQAPDTLSTLQKRIYDVACDTLQLCMHEHYEDCPWREQALYAMDSRNQILCGYYAFHEARFPRASLTLMAQDERKDGLLSICTPSGNDLTIPSFSLHYFTEILEYSRYTGDLSLAAAIFPKLERLMQTFIDHMENDALPVFTDACHWNFYEWSDGLSGRLGDAAQHRFDAALNCLLSLALHAMDCICRLLGRESQYTELQRRVNSTINRLFFDCDKGRYANSTEDVRASELVNALAILCGAADDEAARSIARQLTHDSSDMTTVTLSMRCFKYDALLKVDRDAYQAYILSDIDARYKRMLDAGATSFWETELGEADFGGAGSLCHGWSAMPVYYYHLLLTPSANHPTPYYE